MLRANALHDGDTSHSFLPAWGFTINGSAAGETEQALELAADGQRLVAFTLPVVVTPD